MLTCFGKFHTSRGGICLVDGNGLLQLSAAKGLKESQIKNFHKVTIDTYYKDETFNNYLNENKLVLAQEISSNKKVIGLILLGDRLSGEEYSIEDKNFLQTFLNIAATAIENSDGVSKLKDLNRNLDTKVHQLSALFDLSKEFSSILEIPRVSKLLGYSIIGQLFVSKYAVVIINDDRFEILDSKFPIKELDDAISSLDFLSLNTPISCDEMNIGGCLTLKEIGVELIVPMQIKQNTKGLI